MGLPLFYCLEPECQVRLMNFQWGKYGYKIDIPKDPFNKKVKPIIQLSTEEADKMMRERPRRK